MRTCIKFGVDIHVLYIMSALQNDETPSRLLTSVMENERGSEEVIIVGRTCAGDARCVCLPPAIGTLKRAKVKLKVMGFSTAVPDFL